MKTMSILVVAVCLLACGCAQSPGEVKDQVLVDFGLKPKPEGYKSESDLVRERLDDVGAAELKRLNMEGRFGEVKFQEGEGLSGKYYKERKVYEGYFPLDAKATARGDRSDAAFVGYISYTYRVYQSARKSTRTEAAAASADIATPELGREVYKYQFRSGGVWNREAGERVRD